MRAEGKRGPANPDKGLTILFTGDGKGKTTAGLGCALRASGRGLKTLVVQFMKRPGESGEGVICPAVAGSIEIHAFGGGFFLEGDDPAPHQAKVREAWEFMEKAVGTGKYHLLVLDEINVVLDLGLFPLERVIDFLRARGKTLHVILTGRRAPGQLIDLADIVTEMREIKHHFRTGAPATPGIDY
jgi:cob(I)alamin adenosyltransferase